MLHLCHSVCLLNARHAACMHVHKMIKCAPAGMRHSLNAVVLVQSAHVRVTERLHRDTYDDAGIGGKSVCLGHTSFGARNFTWEKQAAIVWWVRLSDSVCVRGWPSSHLRIVSSSSPECRERARIVFVWASDDESISHWPKFCSQRAPSKREQCAAVAERTLSGGGWEDIMASWSHQIGSMVRADLCEWMLKLYAKLVCACLVSAGRKRWSPLISCTKLYLK